MAAPRRRPDRARGRGGRPGPRRRAAGGGGAGAGENAGAIARVPRDAAPSAVEVTATRSTPSPPVPAAPDIDDLRRRIVYGLGAEELRIGVRAMAPTGTE